LNVTKSTNKVNFQSPKGGPAAFKKVKLEWEAVQAPSALAFPEGFENAFLEQGYVLGWKRFLGWNNKGEEIVDSNRMRTLNAEKWIPVTHEEVKNMGSFGGMTDLWDHADDSFERLKGWIVSGDLALMKRGVEYSEAHREWKHRKAFEQVAGAHNMKKLRMETAGAMPVEDEGTHIRVRKPKFRSEEPAVEIIED